MLKIRFRCAGRIHLPHYRIVVTEASTKRDGKYLDLLGNYDPLKKILHLPNFEKVQD
jgi:small subunit ribosomal protein S16